MRVPSCQRMTNRSHDALVQSLTDRRVRHHAFTPVIHARYHHQLGRNTGGNKATGVIDIFIPEQVLGANADKGRWQAGKIF